MIAKGMIMCFMAVLTAAGFWAYKHYRHEWGYDDPTVVHHWHSNLQTVPGITPPTTVRITLAA